MNMRKTYLLPLFFSLCAAAFAGPFTVSVSVNTSSFSGTTGSVDWQLNPGAGSTQTANVTISNITGATWVAGGPGTVLDLGNVTGSHISGPLTISTAGGAATNDDFENVTFGNNLSFLLNFNGPAVVSPNGTATSPIAYYFSLFTDTNGNNPALTSDGLIASLNINPDGSATKTVYSTAATAIFTPEPATVGMVGSALGLLGLAGWRRRKA
jgi:PEP-CTERM motif